MCTAYQVLQNSQNYSTNLIFKKVQRALKNVLAGTFLPPGSGFATPNLRSKFHIILHITDHNFPVDSEASFHVLHQLLSLDLSPFFCARFLIYSWLSRCFTARGFSTGDPAKGIRLVSSKVTKLPPKI